jgi:hypothetical protein
MATITVGNQNELERALQDVRGGDTILLESGTYDLLELSSSRTKSLDFDQKVTIASADPNNQARVEQLLVRQVANVEFRDIVFDYEIGGGAERPLEATKKFLVENSADVTFDGVTFDGDKRDGYGHGLGLRVKGSEGVSILNSEFIDYEMALSMGTSKDVIVANNKIKGISFDAMMFGGMDDVTIAYNEFTDFHSRHLLHQDVVQFTTSGTSGTSNDIKIVGNYIDNPEETHGFYLGNRMYKDGDMDAYYTNVYIADNRINAADKLAIAVMHGNNVVIENNTLTKNDDEGVQKNIPLINISLYSKNVYILNNDVQMVQDEANGSWVIEDNNTTPGRNEVYLMVYDTTNVAKLLREMPNSPADPYRPVIDVEPDGGHNPGDPEEPISDGVGAELRLKNDMRALYDGGVTVVGFDFGEGDEIIFAQFERQTFRDDFGNNKVDDFDNGMGVRINSALDIQELKAFSPGFEARSTASGDLVIEIEQDRGVAEVTLVGLGAEFDASYRPDLF